MPLPLNVNLAQKFSPKLDEAFARKSYTDAYINKDYDFDGVNSIKVYNLDPVALKDYDVSNNTNRYGGFSEITDTVATYTLANDKTFQTTLDRINQDDSAMAKTAGKWLGIQMNQVVVPEIDKNRFATAVNYATTNTQTAPYVAANVKTLMREMVKEANEVNAPVDGRVFFVSPEAAVDLEDILTPYMSYTSDKIMTEHCPIGKLFGVPVVEVPTDLLPTDVMVIFWHKSAILGARKLTETKILDGAFVLSGNIIQGRFRYDSFVLPGTNKLSGVATKGSTVRVLTN
jgi:hypothetical protein